MIERPIWNLVLFTAGLLYVLMLLDDYSAWPAFSILFVASAAEEILRSHRKRR